ncbi:unnamed protein product [Amoebophrya sp. A25]|nr:unnamed protein product [Amoebophrya sp. A25]|eukprot:GSA25T00018317001.1
MDSVSTPPNGLCEPDHLEAKSGVGQGELLLSDTEEEDMICVGRGRAVQVEDVLLKDEDDRARGSSWSWRR